MTTPKSIGSYIEALFPTASFSFTIGETLESEANQEHYVHWINERAKKIRHQTCFQDTNTGENNYRRALQLLDRFQDYRGCDTGISRTLWSALQTIVKLLACKRDWNNFETGPIYGGSNTTIADRLCLSVDRTKKILKALRSHGLIMFHNRHGNGRRWIRRRDDGRPVGHGFSLLPLLVMLDEFESRIREWREKQFEIANLYITISAKVACAKQSLRAAHGEDANDHHAFISCHATLKLAIKAKGRRDIEMLNVLADQFEQNHVSKIENPTLDGGGNTPPLLTPLIKPMKVAANQIERSEDHSLPSDFGLESIGFDEGEIEHLFPVSSPYIQLHRRLDRAAKHIAQDSAIPNDLWQQMRTALGDKAAMVSVLLIAERLAAGEIRSTSSAYAHGMLNAARRGELQLGRSIWGRREQLVA